MPGKIWAVVYASPTADPSAAEMTRVRRKPVPRLTRLPAAMTALLPAALPLGFSAGDVLSTIGWSIGSARITPRPSGAACALRYTRPDVTIQTLSPGDQGCALGPIRWRSHVRNILPTRDFARPERRAATRGRRVVARLAGARRARAAVRKGGPRVAPRRRPG